jgi:hypothetical protein
MRMTTSPRIGEGQHVPEDSSPGSAFATALAGKDFSAIERLLADDIDFKGLTPRRVWEASEASAVREILEQWFEPEDEVLSLDALETDAFADRERVGYRLAVRNPDGRFLVEQQAYVGARDGRIEWMRVVCSGFRPVGER